MKLKKNIAISETGFLFNPTSGDSFSSNQIGVDIINLIKEGKSSAEVKRFILTKYEVPPALLEKDFIDFVAQLQDFNILESEK